MVRFLILLAIACLACRWIFGKWPWEFLSPVPTRQQAVFKARKLLGVSASADHAEIRAAHRRLATLVHPDKGGSDRQIQEANDARDLLLDELPYEPPAPPSPPEDQA